MKVIPISDIENVCIGQVENAAAATGCTVLVSEKGMSAGLDVRGGGPASRESELLKPTAAAQLIHAIVLSGGSAFGLGAADGVMRCLAEHDIGFDTGICKVPLVCQSDIFDLGIGRSDVYPGSQDGYRAAQCALSGGNYRDGNFGVGCGATVGKWHGMRDCMKSGVGSFAVQLGELKVGAVVCVNALGDVYDAHSGRQIAGLLNEAHTGLLDTVSQMCTGIEAVENKFTGNTTIGVVLTNGAFDKTRLCKISSMAHNGYARAIRPVHTSADGDSIYAVSVGNVSADQDLVGTLAADVMAEAIVNAVTSCDSLAGYPSLRDLHLN